MFAGINAEPFDAAEYRVHAASVEVPQVWFAQGTLCSTATDAAACQAQVAAAGDKAGLAFSGFLPMYGMIARYVVTTHGDDVRRYQSRAELLQFLGPIDTPQDALLLLHYDGHNVLCALPPNTTLDGIDPQSMRQLDDGYQVIGVTQETGCTGTRTERVTLHVAIDGTVMETARETMEPPQLGCP